MIFKEQNLQQRDREGEAKQGRTLHRFQQVTL